MSWSVEKDEDIFISNDSYDLELTETSGEISGIKKPSEEVSTGKYKYKASVLREVYKVKLLLLLIVVEVVIEAHNQDKVLLLLKIN